jgi:hypothetical protein
MFMKTVKTTFVAGIIFVLMALMTLTTLTACGGSGGGHGHNSSDDPASAESDDPASAESDDPAPVPTLISTWYVDSRDEVGDDDNNNGQSRDAPLRSVQAALEQAAAYKEAHSDEWDAGDYSAQIVILYLDGNIIIDLDAKPPKPPYPPFTLGGTSTSENPATINGTLTIKGSPDSPAITLAHVTLNGGGSGDVVTVEGGNLVMEAGAVITGGDNGIVVTGGTFDMSGGVVGGYPKGSGGNTGNGVVVTGGTAEMSGGMIWGNGRNGVEMTGGTFNMTGGEIGANGRVGVDTSGGGVFTKKKGGGTVYGGDLHTSKLMRNAFGSINTNQGTYGLDDSYPPGQ